ncbi:MAG: response regulator [Anaerolineaceae bacterium]|nr:MAG: response regulator [Anaerolineaceae bacterium]
MKRIWVVDDDEEMLRAVRLMLGVLNYNATTFLGARSAAQTLLDSDRPDLMILDISMPEVTGLDLLEFIRRTPATKSLPVVMLSTEASDVMVDRARALGADAYVSKPVTVEELERALNEAFEKGK